MLVKCEPSPYNILDHIPEPISIFPKNYHLSFDQYALQVLDCSHKSRDQTPMGKISM